MFRMKVPCQRFTALVVIHSILWMLCPVMVDAQSGNPMAGMEGFIENKGQIVDQNYRPNTSVHYLLNLPGMNAQLRKGGFSYDLLSISTTDSVVFFHRIDFTLVNADSLCRIIRRDPVAHYRNYYTRGTPTGGVQDVQSFREVIFENIYPNIDLEFRAGDGPGFKYNFMVSPGGKVEDILLQIKGPEVMVTPEGSLMLKTPIGTVVEEIPMSFILREGEREPVKVRFSRIGDDLYGLTVDQALAPNLALVIDPTPRRLWGSYYGGTNSETAGDITMDISGNLYFCGSTFSTGNIATSGTYQATLKGFYDSFLVRFNLDGQRIWGTYFGGTGQETFEACTCDNHGNIYLAGRTNSNSFIATPGSHQIIYGGGLHDNYLARFNPAGQLIWATYYGGSDTEGHVECATDNSLNVYLCGYSSSTDNISTPGAYQPVNGGNIDAYLVRFDSNGVRTWGTYYGGTADDQAYSCCISNDGHIYMAGKTLSETGISTPGSHQTLHAGGGDAFLVKFTTACQRIWGTYYGGLNTDESHGVVVDTTDNVYFGGYTTSNENISTPGSQQLNYGGFGDGFISRFNPDGVRQWGTYCGGILQETVSKKVLSVDDSCFVFFSGTTNSTENIATDSAYQTTIGGNFDAFLVKYNEQGLRIWGTYYGGPALDDGVASVSDNCGHQYLLGSTTSLAGISTPGTQQPAPGGSQDAFLVKLTDCIPPDTAEQISGPASVCANSNGILYTVPVISRATGYSWNLPAGFTIISGSNTNAITVNVEGNALSGLITIHGISCCDIGMSSSLSVTVSPRPVPAIFGNDTVCEGTGAFFYTGSGNSLYQWMVSPGGTILSGGGANDTSVSVSWNITGSQWITVNYADTNDCNALTPSIRNIYVSVGSPVDVTISAARNNLCESIPVNFTAIPTNGGSNPVYQWKVNSVISGTNSPDFTYSPSNGDLVQCMLTSSNTVCTSNNPASSNTITMVVYPNLPVSVSVSTSQNPVCAGTSVTFTATPTNGGITPSYQWKVNGINVGTNNPSYSYTPLNNDIVTCILTSSETCTSGNPASSNIVAMTVNPLLPVTVSITPSSNPFCIGNPVIFTATPTNGGMIPFYQWRVNEVNAGTNSPNYTFSPSDNDTVRCVMTSDLTCVSNNPAGSNTIILSGILPPEVTFTSCFDTITTLNAKPIKLKGGIPLNGTYSGPGVNSTTGIFTPSMAGFGLKTITYSCTNASLCSASKNKTIFVQSTPSFNCGNNLTDIRDNKVYPTVQIGSQCWMAANLNYGTVVNSPQLQYDNCVCEKYCYNNLNSNCSTYGGLYRWDELMQYNDSPANQGLCPPGWHVPAESEWNTLFSNWINNAFAGAPLKYSGFSGFNAFLSGVGHQNVQWNFQDFAIFFWSATSYGQNKAWSHGMNAFDPSVSLYPSLRSNAFPARCLKD